MNFGWPKLYEASKATFNKQVSEQGKFPRKKRPYDNSKREAHASYKRQGDKYKKNGQDPARISSVLATDQCLCA